MLQNNMGALQKYYTFFTYTHNKREGKRFFFDATRKENIFQVCASMRCRNKKIEKFKQHENSERVYIQSPARSVCVIFFLMYATTLRTLNLILRFSGIKGIIFYALRHTRYSYV